MSLKWTLAGAGAMQGGLMAQQNQVYQRMADARAAAEAKRKESLEMLRAQNNRENAMFARQLDAGVFDTGLGIQAPKKTPVSLLGELNDAGIPVERLSPEQLRMVQSGEVDLANMAVEPAAPDVPAIQRNLEAAGYTPGSKEYQEALRNILMKPQTQVTIGEGSFKVPQGYMLADPDDPSKGVVPIPGGPKDTLNAEQAAKIQMIETSRESLDSLREMIVPGGEVDRQLLATMTANAPFTDGRTAKVLLLDMVEAKLRAESGAAVPDSEVSRAMRRFQPSLLDTDETIVQRLDLLQNFLDGAFDKMDRSGRFSIENTLRAIPPISGSEDQSDDDILSELENF